MVTKIGAPLSSSTAVPSTGPDAGTITVKTGDTLFSIAKKLGVTVEDLMAANPGLEAGHVKPGQELTIPRPDFTESPQVEAPSSGGAGAAEKKEEAALAEKAKATELQSEIGGSASKPIQAADPKKVLKEGSKGPEVKEFQQQLNAALKSAGLPEIAESGVFDAATKKAVTEFQDSNKFIRESGGKAGVETRDMVALESNSAFQNLDFSSKVAVNGLLTSWKDNPSARNNIMSIATDPAFGKLDEKETEAVLAKLAQNPGTTNIGSVKQAMKEFVDLKEDPNFKKLDREVADTFTRAFFAISPKTPQAREDLAGILKSPEFGKLSPDVQEKAGESFFANSGDAAFTKGIKDLAGSSAFSGLPKDEQIRILETVKSNPDAALATALAEKARDGKLSGKEEFLKEMKTAAGIQEKGDVQEAPGEAGTDPMDGLSGYTRGQVKGLLESWKGNPTAKANLTQLATNPDFQKLSDEEQQVVLRKFIQKPETDQIGSLLGAVKEFTAIRSDPNFQNLSTERKEELSRAFFYIGLKNEQGRADLAALLKDPEFTKLPSDVQARAGEAFFRGIDDPEFSKGYRDLLGGKGFAGLPEPEQAKLLETIRDNPDNRLVGELARLSRLGVLDNLGEEGLGALMQEFGLGKK